jgi:hypothetical protein
MGNKSPVSRQHLYAMSVEHHAKAHYSWQLSRFVMRLGAPQGLAHHHAWDDRAAYGE